MLGQDLTDPRGQNDNRKETPSVGVVAVVCQTGNATWEFLTFARIKLSKLVFRCGLTGAS
jgi:hypothetical protein